MRTLKQWQNYQQLELIPDITSRKGKSSRSSAVERQGCAGHNWSASKALCGLRSLMIFRMITFCTLGKALSATCHGKVVGEALATT